MYFKKQRYLFWFILFVILFIFLQWQYAYLFYYQEQLQLFLFSKEYAWNILKNPGGFANYIAGFLQQFYILAGFGAGCTSLLLVGCGYLFQRILDKWMLGEPYWSYVLSIFPLYYLLILHLDENYQISGTIALICCMFLWLVYFSLAGQMKRMVAIVAFDTILYWGAGPVFVLFSCAVAIYEVIFRKKCWGYTLLLSVIITLSWIFWSFAQAWQGELRLIVLPDFYYEYLLNADTTYYVWGSVLLMLFFAVFFRKKNLRGWVAALLILSIGIVGFIKIYQTEDKTQMYAYERDYYLRNQQWKQIISSFSLDKATIPTMNLLNLALACSQRLGSQMFTYPQNGSETLLTSWDGSLKDAAICSEIFYQVGDIASAQKFAFEGLVITTKGNPRFLKRLIETNIIYGAYSVASKYIHLLEQTFFYKKWASSQRIYLSEEGVLKSPEYISKRKGLYNNGIYAVSENFLKTLEQLFVNNPDNSMALQYLSTFYLLNKDLSKFKRLYENYYHTPVWMELTVHQQEAIIAIEQNNPQKWAKLGVSWQVEQAYGAFSQDMANKQNFMNFVDEMKHDYGKTYWFYLLFTK